MFFDSNAFLWVSLVPYRHALCKLLLQSYYLKKMNSSIFSVFISVLSLVIYCH